MRLLSLSFMVLFFFGCQPSPQELAVNVYNASYNGDLNRLKVYLSEGASVNFTTNNGFTPLMAAVFKDHEEIVHLLVEHKADVNYKNRKQLNAMFYAITKNIDILKYLLAHGAKVDDTVLNGITPLMMASEDGNINVVQLLLKHKADIHKISGNNISALGYAAAQGKMDVVKLLIEKGAEVDTKQMAGYSALNLAAQQGHLDVVKYLVSKGADVKAIDPRGGFTLLFASSFHGRVEVVKYLLDNGANANVVTTQGYSALKNAINAALGKKGNRNHLKIIDLLIAHGAQPDEQDKVKISTIRKIDKLASSKR